MIVRVLLGLGGALLLAWLALIVMLVVARPNGDLLQQALRLLPDLLRLLRRLAGDPSLPRGVRVRLWLLLAYLAIPIDVIPDFIPILGYADDAIIVGPSRTTQDIQACTAANEGSPPTPGRQRSSLSSGRGTAARILRRPAAATLGGPGDQAHPTGPSPVVMAS